MRWHAIAAGILGLAMLGSATRAQISPPGLPLPESIDEFRAATAAVLRETGVPGAGIALVRSDRVEWEGGVGVADRERQIPVTADTSFRVGSVSKSLVALALVQLSEEGLVDLDAPVRTVVPDVVIDNPWEEHHPVRIIHLLQHTAGFDDMHFNEMYLTPGEDDPSLAAVMARNPRSRRVRWPPGTRMAYSNPGYGLAGWVIEKIAEEPYEDYIAREIFEPLEMTASSFRLTPADHARLAQGYRDSTGPPVGFPPIYLRPAGNLHTTARDLGRFVQMLLNWGARGDNYVVDPEYLGNMEAPRTTLAAEAGLRHGYGSGISLRVDLPYKVLGHNGGIDGFVSSYGYSPSRDVGYVVLLNSAGPRAAEALTRLSSLAIRYLKRDVEPQAPPRADVPADVLDRYTGYYHEASPRNQLAWAVDWLRAGVSVRREGMDLLLTPVVGSSFRLIPVSETTFRRDEEIDASRVFATDAVGRMVLTGIGTFAERRPRWQVEMVRVPVLAIIPVLASVFVMSAIWAVRVRRARPRLFWELKLALLLCPLAVLLPVAGLATTPMSDWGRTNAGTVAVFVGTLAVPTMALVVCALTLMAVREGASRALVTYAGAIALTMGGLSLYLSAHDLLGLRLWVY